MKSVFLRYLGFIIILFGLNSFYLTTVSYSPQVIITVIATIFYLFITMFLAKILIRKSVWFHLVLVLLSLVIWPFVTTFLLKLEGLQYKN